MKLKNSTVLGTFLIKILFARGVRPTLFQIVVQSLWEVGFWCFLFGGFSDFVFYFKKECYICYEISFEVVRLLLNLYKVSVTRCFEIFEKNKNAKIEIFAQSLQIE